MEPLKSISITEESLSPGNETYNFYIEEYQAHIKTAGRNETLSPLEEAMQFIVAHHPTVEKGELQRYLQEVNYSDEVIPSSSAPN